MKKLPCAQLSTRSTPKISDRPDATMNRNIAAVRPLRLCATRNEGSTMSCLLAHDLFRKPVSTFRDHASVLDEAELLRDEHRLLPHLLAPARDERLLEAHLRHRDADRGERRAAVVIAHRDCDAAQVRHEFLEIEREAALAHLADLAPQLRLAGHGLRREVLQRDALHVLVEL